MREVKARDTDLLSADFLVVGRLGSGMPSTRTTCRIIKELWTAPTFSILHGEMKHDPLLGWRNFRKLYPQINLFNHVDKFLIKGHFRTKLS